MAKFSEIAKGRLARHTTELPLANGEVVKIAVRPLLDYDDDAIETKALAYAKARDVAEPKAGDPIYDRGVALHTLLLSCSDPDSSSEDPVPFFDDIEQIQKHLDRDRIAWLMTAQQVWQDECSPRRKDMSPDEFIEHVREVATAGPSNPFASWAPGLQLSFMRTLAALYLNSQMHKSHSGSDTETNSSGSATQVGNA